MRSPVRRPSSGATMVVALAALALALASFTMSGADASAAHRKADALTRADVTRIVKELAPTLSVRRAVVAEQAATAGRATSLDGLGARQFSLSIADDGPEQVLFRLGGLTVTASCPYGAPTLVASAAGGRIRAQAVRSDDTMFNEGVRELSTPVQVNDSATGLSSGFLEYTAGEGRAVSASWGYRDDSPDCVFFGTAVGG